MGNIFGKVFTLSTWGESHGGGIGVVVDGCPPNLPLSETDIQVELDRRRPGQSPITTTRKETDKVTIVSGVYEGRTLGTPIAMSVANIDARSKDYDELKKKYRPSHADFTYDKKYGIRMVEGGGRASARETIGRVAAGAIAKKLLRSAGGVDIIAYIDRIQNIEAPLMEDFPSLEQVEKTPVRCPDDATAEKMIECIKAARKDGDSLGGTIVCRVRNLPAGLGEPVFDRLEADLAKAMLSLPATKGFEIGSGFSGTYLTGSQHNDPFENRDGRIRTSTNNSGGVQGGISNGEELFIRIAFKPTSTILKTQKTVTIDGEETELKGRGRHDPCVLPRAVPIVEAMTALVIVDHWMRQHAQRRAFEFDV